MTGEVEVNCWRFSWSMKNFPTKIFSLRESVILLRIWVKKHNVSAKLPEVRKLEKGKDRQNGGFCNSICVILTIFGLLQNLGS
jgi:hypothetical protein